METTLLAGKRRVFGTVAWLWVLCWLALVLVVPGCASTPSASLMHPEISVAPRDAKPTNTTTATPTASSQVTVVVTPDMRPRAVVSEGDAAGWRAATTSAPAAEQIETTSPAAEPVEDLDAEVATPEPQPAESASEVREEAAAVVPLKTTPTLAKPRPEPGEKLALSWMGEPFPAPVATSSEPLGLPGETFGELSNRFDDQLAEAKRAAEEKFRRVMAWVYGIVGSMGGGSALGLAYMRAKGIGVGDVIAKLSDLADLSDRVDRAEATSQESSTLAKKAARRAGAVVKQVREFQGGNTTES